MSLSSGQGKTNKFKDIVLKNRSILKSITLLSNLEFRRSLSVDKDESLIDTSNPTSSSASDADTSNTSRNTRVEEFNLERLAFDIDTVYDDF